MRLGRTIYLIRAPVRTALRLEVFEELRGFHALLQALQRQCKPFGRHYHAIAITLDALETTAYHFTRRPHF